MKTLDEVIKANECCDHGEPDSRCEECPYNGLGACCAERESDALHYLKEYRSDKAMWEADRKGYLDWIEQYKESREKHQQAVIELKKNPPLTWEQLKEMEGKPVWVETQTKGGRWMILSYLGNVYEPDDTVMFASGYNGGTSTCYKKNIGKTWQAYRKERDAR